MRNDNKGGQQDMDPSAGVLLINLGTPDEPSPGALRRYLAEFLSDPRVIETPAFLWQPVLHGIILRTRPRKSAQKYKLIWTEAGSPLLVKSQCQAMGIRSALAARTVGPVHLELGMRYGNPSVRSALRSLARRNLQRLLVLPLYPQYSAATTASSADAVMQELRTWRDLPELRLIKHYHDDPGYIGALAAAIGKHRQSRGSDRKLLFSFHGLPEKQSLAGDPYRDECLKTAHLVAQQTRLSESEWAVSFQSRFGPVEWLRPYTNDILREWGAGAVKNVDVICPGFAADCLETLEEIAIQGREVFLAAGGRDYAYIPALNDEPAHIEFLTDLILKHTCGWPEFISCS